MLYDDYINYCLTYHSKYGDRTVVLMEVGSFFECYAVENETTKEGANLSEICSILNIQSTRKNKSITECSRSNPMMAGFPSHALSKFIELLLAEQYTIVLVEQTTPPPNPERAVTRVISPGTQMEEIGHASNYLMVVYLTTYTERWLKTVSFGLCCCMVDVSTGEVIVLDEFHGVETDLVNEWSRVVTAYGPREVFVIGEPSIYLPSRMVIRDQRAGVGITKLQPFQTIAYQQAILKKVYPDTGLLSPIEYIDLERYPDSVVALTYLLNLTYEHNEKLVERLRKPLRIPSMSRLLLTNTSADQLNLPALLNLINVCDTSMGKRYMKACLLSPSTDPTVMETRYRYIDACQPHIENLRPHLAQVKDVERLFRRIQLSLLQPAEMVSVDKSLHAIEHLRSVNPTELKIPSILPLIHHYQQRWDMTKISTQDHFYHTGIHRHLDELQGHIQTIHDTFHRVVEKANEGYTEPIFKLEQTGERSERTEYQILITKKRYDTYTLSHKNHTFTAQPISPANKTMLRVSFPDMATLQQDLARLVGQLRRETERIYQTDLASFSVFIEQMAQIVAFVSQLDVSVAAARHAKQHRYVRPQTVESTSVSYIQATQVRHPLIEVIQRDIAYVPNDVDTRNGLLLYGINAAGKSSYMKSIGLNLIMAQAGLYVAADSFLFSPYHHVFTRIPGGDNLFKGQSTFVAEIAELRTILRHSTRHSLVIGDELASGTESVSAIAIVAAGIKTLCERQVSFLFATHLHEVAQLATIKSIPTTLLRIAHLSVRYDTEHNRLIYDRLLRDGCGETMYGLEVCKSLDLPHEFLHLANTIRQEHLGMSTTIVRQQTSRYSNEIMVDTCSVCKNPAKEVHHIKEQHKADEHGFIGRIHKNDTHNLMTVCETCHDEIHHRHIRVDGYRQTSQGKQLIVESVKENESEKDEDINGLVQSMRKDGKSLKAISTELHISTYRVKRLLEVNNNM